MNHPLNSIRYVELVGQVRHTLVLLNRYLELKIKKMERKQNEVTNER